MPPGGDWPRTPPAANSFVHDIFDPGLDFAAWSADCVVSVFAICHAQGDASYAELYRRIYRWLKPGGYFACYDHVRGDTFELTALNALGWHRLLAASQTAELSEGWHCRNLQEDSPLSLRQHVMSALSGGLLGRGRALQARHIFHLRRRQVTRRIHSSSTDEVSPFLGTAAANAFPEAFCACANCQSGAAAGSGPSLRKRSAALINDDL
jgi:SAM-dependent methyltransferase